MNIRYAMVDNKNRYENELPCSEETYSSFFLNKLIDLRARHECWSAI